MKNVYRGIKEGLLNDRHRVDDDDGNDDGGNDDGGNDDEEEISAFWTEVRVRNIILSSVFSLMVMD